MSKDSQIIVYLGPEGSYSHMAAEKAAKLLGFNDYFLKSENSIKNIINLVDKNKDYIGILPIENSIEGVIRESVDNIITTNEDLVVFQEIILPINHCLIARGNDLLKVRNITAIPAAYAQCYHYIGDEISKKNNIEIQIHPSSSNSEAVRSLLELDETYAAIGNEKSAELYGMKVLLNGINDENDNKTRFICIGYKKSELKGFYRTSIAFETKNEAGALVDVLEIFKGNNINLSFIESRPSKKIWGDYTFFMDFDGHIEDENVKNAVEKIKLTVDFFRLIGSYTRCNSLNNKE